MDCARSHTPGYRSDSTTAQAVNNLVACIGAGTGVANIVGHGNDGLIVTGQGQAPSDPQRFITTWNENIWGPLCRALRGKATTIKLWACHPGTAQAGADLLYAMMQETNATCMGPTGFLYCGPQGLYLEGNSTWQVASPGHPKPNPIPAPTPHFIVSIATWNLNMGGAPVVTLADVHTVEVRRDGNSLLSLRDDAARSFLRLVDFSNPFHIEGFVGAIITGELTITHHDASGTPHEEKFLIYNNRLVVRDVDPPLYYQCSEGFAQALTIGIR